MYVLIPLLFSCSSSFVFFFQISIISLVSNTQIEIYFTNIRSISSHESLFQLLMNLANVFYEYNTSMFFLLLTVSIVAYKQYMAHYHSTVLFVSHQIPIIFFFPLLNEIQVNVAMLSEIFDSDPSLFASLLDSLNAYFGTNQLLLYNDPIFYYISQFFSYINQYNSPAFSTILNQYLERPSTMLSCKILLLHSAPFYTLQPLLSSFQFTDPFVILEVLIGLIEKCKFTTNQVFLFSMTHCVEREDCLWVYSTLFFITFQCTTNCNLYIYLYQQFIIQFHSCHTY